MPIMRNVHLISVQSWTYLKEQAKKIAKESEPEIERGGKILASNDAK